MEKLLKGPLAITIPILAIAAVVGTGIGFGLLMLFFNNEFSSDMALVAAAVLTIVIMGGAALLSRNDTGRTAEASTARATARRASAVPEDARVPATDRPSRGDSANRDGSH